MRTIFNPEDCATLLRRVDMLRPQQPALWGQMDAPHMVCHLTCAFQASLGELEVGPPEGPFSRAPFNWLVIYVLPWPKGKAESPPEFLGRAPTEWQTDVKTLRGLVERSSTRGPNESWPPSRAFGHISGRAWGVLHYKHLDHHLRQFGV